MSAASKLVQARSYGELVYQSVVDIVGDEWLRAQLSPLTQANVGAYLASAYEIATIAVAGDAPKAIQALFELSVDIVVDVVADIAATSLAVIGTVVPIAMAMLDMLIGWVDAAIAAEKARSAQRAVEAALKCQEEIPQWQPVPTGPGGSFKPADFFRLAYRQGFDEHGQPIWVDRGIPYFGRMLRAVTETQFPAIAPQGS